MRIFVHKLLQKKTGGHAGLWITNGLNEPATSISRQPDYTIEVRYMMDLSGQFEAHG